jgi:hypothetical protein
MHRQSIHQPTEDRTAAVQPQADDSRRHSHYGRTMGDVVRGLRQGLVMLIFSAVAALVVAGLWWALQGGGFRSKVGIVSMVIAGLINLTGGTAFSRAADYEARAFLGMAADRDEPDTGEGLTGLGIFLFVSLPLFIAGGALYGSG